MSAEKRPAMSAERRLRQLGIELPEVSPPVANYVNAVRSGKLLFLAGKGPSAVDGLRPMGKLGREFSVEQGYKFARSVGLALLAVMKAELGSLDRVARVVKLLGMVNAIPDFADQPKVINGCSDLFVEVFGARGRHARSAVGMGSLPSGIPVEIEAIVEVAARPARRNKPAARKRRR
jgi:enamine deaminase RidA (YjgF/YER057c/UK114 family)